MAEVFDFVERDSEESDSEEFIERMRAQRSEPKKKEMIKQLMA